MMSLMRNVLFYCIVSLVLSQSIHAKQLEGVNFDDVATVGGQRLVLNGVGLGQQLTEKIVVAGLYLGNKQTSGDAVIAQAGAKRLELVYLRKLSSKAMSRALTKAMRDSDEKSELTKDPVALAEWGQTFDSAGDRNAGDRVTIDWIPGTGMEMRLNGRLLESKPNKNEAIFRLLLRIHVGPKARERMREGLLGGDKA
jgi:Chalcone isomerase-like